MTGYLAKLRDGTIHRFDAETIDDARAFAKHAKWRHVIWVGVDGSRAPIKGPKPPKGRSGRRGR